MNKAIDKFGFSNSEVITCLIAYRGQIDILKRIRPWLYENLPGVLGISKKQWKARRLLYRIIFESRIIRRARNMTYCQIGKRVVVSVIIDVISASGKSEAEQRDALEKIKEAFDFFEPVPVLQPGNPKGKVDAIHKGWADKLAFQEIERIEEHIGVPFYDYRTWPPTKNTVYTSNHADL